jgi:hypothetical protein
MNTQIASKMTFFAAALMMNGLIVAGVGYLFNAEPHLQSSAVATWTTSAHPAGEVA